MSPFQFFVDITWAGFNYLAIFYIFGFVVGAASRNIREFVTGAI